MVWLLLAGFGSVVLVRAELDFRVGVDVQVCSACLCLRPKLKKESQLPRARFSGREQEVSSSCSASCQISNSTNLHSLLIKASHVAN